MEGSIPYSRALRLGGICSSEKDFGGYVDLMGVWFLAGDYPENVVNGRIDEVVFGKNQPSGGGGGVLGVVFLLWLPVALGSRNLEGWLRICFLFYIVMGRFEGFSRLLRWSHVGGTGGMGDCLVRSKLYPLDRGVGCGGCGGGGCRVCGNMRVADAFDSFTTGKSCRINHRFGCNGGCLVCLFGCGACGGRYAGKTADRFGCGWNNYKMDAGGPESGDMEGVGQEFLQSHFLQEDHKGFLEDVEVGLIDGTRGSGPAKRGCYWMRTLGTLCPGGLNIESDY